MTKNTFQLKEKENIVNSNKDEETDFDKTQKLRSYSFKGYEIFHSYEKNLEKITSDEEKDIKNKDHFEKILSNYFKSLKNNNSLEGKLDNYDPWKNIYEKPKKDVEILYVSSQSLPFGFGWRVLGMYDPRTHTVYIADNLPSYVQNWVFHHEIGHSKGLGSERQANEYAFMQTGYYLSA